MRTLLVLFSFLLLLAGSATAQSAQDTVRFYQLEAAGSVPRVVEKVKMEINKRRLQIFSITDHGSAAADAKMDLSPTVLITFGNPGVGTLLMQADPRMGAELPLKILVWEEDGRTYVGYANPLNWLGEYRLDSQTETVNKISQIMGGILIHACQ